MVWFACTRNGRQLSSASTGDPLAFWEIEENQNAYL